MCRTCHDKALTVRGCCPGYGQDRILPGRRDDAPVCTACAGFTYSYACSPLRDRRQAARRPAVQPLHPERPGHRGPRRRHRPYPVAARTAGRSAGWRGPRVVGPGLAAHAGRRRLVALAGPRRDSAHPCCFPRPAAVAGRSSSQLAAGGTLRSFESVRGEGPCRRRGGMGGASGGRGPPAGPWSSSTSAPTTTSYRGPRLRGVCERAARGHAPRTRRWPRLRDGPGEANGTTLVVA